MRAPRSFFSAPTSGRRNSGGRPDDCQSEPANRVQEDIHALERYRGLPAALKRSVELREQGVAVPPLDHGRLHGMVLLAVARKWVSVARKWVSKDDQSTFRADRQAHIRQWGPCAPKTLFDVHGSASLCCWLVAVPALPLYQPCRSEDTGGGRERPPVLDCLDRQCGVDSCARPMPRP